MSTILEVIEKGTQYLASKSIENPRLNMELLVAHELDLKRVDLYLRFDQPLNETQLGQLRKNLKKRSEGQPIQHITGNSYFLNLRLKSDHRALIPRPETEELVELILQSPLNQPARILDMGCGSGVIGISLAKALGTKCEQVILADLFTEALDLTRENCEEQRVEAELVHSDLFTSLAGRRFDLIVANLPYVALRDEAELSAEVRYDPRSALFSGEDGLDLIRRFCAEVSEHLTPGGLVAMEVGYDQGEVTCDLLRAAGFGEVSLHQDLSGIGRFPLARKA